MLTTVLSSIIHKHELHDVVPSLERFLKYRTFWAAHLPTMATGSAPAERMDASGGEFMLRV